MQWQEVGESRNEGDNKPRKHRSSTDSHQLNVEKKEEVKDVGYLWMKCKS